MIKDLINQNSTTRNSKSETTPIVEQHSLWGKQSKILVLGIILLIVFVGLFSPVRKASASEYTQCITDQTVINSGMVDAKGNKDVAAQTAAAQKACSGKAGDPNNIGSTGNSALENNLQSCGVIGSSSLEGCLVKITYIVFYTVPSLLLSVAAEFLDVLLSITLSSALYTKSSFIPNAWAVVRDLSNIFFILILLYIAIKVILGLGGADVKKMIVKVIVVALLINFSMFFTEVIIDTSNILALIFYNKINVNQQIGTGTTATNIEYKPITDPTKTGNTEKDFAGGLAKAFKPGEMLTQEFFDKAKKQTSSRPTMVGTAATAGTGAVFGGVVGAGVATAAYLAYSFIPSNAIPAPFMIGIILISGLIMAFAAYAFFIAGFCFLSRLIELWILIIFSPFAFMSSTLPIFSSVEYLGWDAWSKRLLKVAFMAPIFMFFLYLIFLLVKADLFASLAVRNFKDQSTLEAIVLLVIPALLVLILLLQATKFAKKASGELGEAIFKGAKIAGGLALGATAIGAAKVGRATAGRAGSAMANSRWAKNWEASGFGGEAAMSGFKKMQSGSFDVRGASIGGKTLASATGMKVGEAQKGGFKERREQDVKKRMERAKEIEVGEDEKEMQTVREKEGKLQAAKIAAAPQILALTEGTAGTLDKDGNPIEGAGQSLKQLERAATQAERDLADAERELKAAQAADPTGKSARVKNAIDEQVRLQGEKTNTRQLVLTREKDIRDAGSDTHTAEVALKVAENAVVGVNRERKTKYAEKLEGSGSRALNFIFSGGEYALHRGANEAANKIRASIQEEKK